MLLAFHINLINSKCCTQHTYANFFISLLIINFWFYLLYSDVFTTKHKHPLFMTPSSCTTFRLLAHVSLLQCSIPSNLLAFRSILAHISAGYPCISSSWTQWVKNNNRPNYRQELNRVLTWPSSHYSNYPWSFFFFKGNLVTHDVVASLFYFCFIYTFFFIFYKSNKCMC